MEVLYLAWLHLMKSRHLFTSILKNVEVVPRVLRKALHEKLIELICFLSQTMNWVNSPSRLQALSLRTRSLRSFYLFIFFFYICEGHQSLCYSYTSPYILVQFSNVQFYCLHIQLLCLNETQAVKSVYVVYALLNTLCSTQTFQYTNVTVH